MKDPHSQRKRPGCRLHRPLRHRDRCRGQVGRCARCSFGSPERSLKNRILDVGCGTGDKAQYLAEHGAAHVLAIDPNESFARQGQYAKADRTWNGFQADLTTYCRSFNDTTDNSIPSSASRLSCAQMI
ncbi:class I SAM-dependent methyltransferase [Edaphobacter sp.]|uniref:class I SAM-dependent methyltransferase n=1 Tax=Edaphobacter sp. TaxID=1934404 RepID=UPI0039C86694